VSRPRPAPLLLAALAWVAMGAALTPLLLPPAAAYRTAVVATGAVLFVAALAVPRAAFVLAILAVTASGISSFLFGGREPAWSGPIPLAGYLAGSCLRRLYEVDEPPAPAPLLPAWRALAAAAAVSAAASWVALRTSLLIRLDVPPPRVVNVLGEDAANAFPGVLVILASLLVVAGIHRAAARLGAEPAGRRAIDTALVAAALLAGGVALLQKVGTLPVWRAEPWLGWGRAQSVFTDPSAAGVAAALLLAPLLARATTGSAAARLLAALGVALVLLVLADAGSRAGLIGALTAGSVYIIWAVTRLVAGARGGRRWRVAWSVGGLAILSAAALAAALSWPNRGAVRSALLARIEGTLRPGRTPSEGTPERLLLYEAAWSLFRTRPIAGIGLGGFRTEFPTTAEALGRPVKWTDHPPSLYLGTLAESGLAGGLLLLLLVLAIIRGAGRALFMVDASAETALPAVGAAAALIGLLVVFLFGSHLVYPEIAALVGLLTARLPIRPDGRTARLLAGLLPVALAGVIVLLAGGVVRTAWMTRTEEAAFRFSPVAGAFGIEREPDGRRFRWTGEAAAWRVAGEPVPTRTLSLPVRNARPDRRPLTVSVSWNGRFLGRVTLAAEGWKRLEVPIAGPGVFRLGISETFRPTRPEDTRHLGIEVGADFP
jgi:O-antigen ligase